MSASPAKVAQLKESAAEHFKQKDFVKASQLYTEAIRLDKNNATLWSNRAACRQSLRQYVGAAYDADKAIALDPDYSKAHARLAQARDALGQPWWSAGAWNKAIVTQRYPGVPHLQEELRETLLHEFTKSQSNQKELLSDYGQNWNKAMTKWLSPPTQPCKVPGGLERPQVVPYLGVHAARINPKCAKPKDGCCAVYTTYAYDELDKGLEMMTGQMTDDHFEPSLGPVFYEPKPIVEQLTEAILYDTRAWELATSKYAPRRFFDQAYFEAERANVSSWVEGTNFETIKREANQRLKREGWVGDGTWVSGLKSALGVAIRSMVLIGFVNAEALGNRELEVEMLSLAIKLIKWGRREWKTILKGKDMGVLDSNFLRIIQSKQLQALFAHHNRTVRLGGKQKNDPVLVQVRKQIRELADEVLSSLETNKPSKESILEKMAFYTIPKGHALAKKGFCIQRESELTSDQGEKQRLIRECLDLYLAAVECFPKDDERYLETANTALSLMYKNTSIASGQETYDLLEKMDKAFPDVMYIWSYELVSTGEALDYATLHFMFGNLNKIMSKAGLTRDDLTDKRILLGKQIKIVPLSDKLALD